MGKVDNIKLEHQITKVDEEQRVAAGWASVIEVAGEPVVDSQGDVITEDTLVKMARRFVSETRKAKAMHKGGQVGEIVESLVMTKAVQNAMGINLGKVGWWIAVKVNSDKIWQKVKSGELRAFSIGGRGRRTEVSQ